MGRWFAKGLALALMLAGAAPAAATWREASSPHFVIYSEASETALRQFADRLERYDAAMRYLRGVPARDPGAANRLTVFVVDDTSDVRSLMLRGGRDIAGFYVPRAGGSVAVVPRRGVGDSRRFGLDAETILLHEYAHHFMLENFPAGFPAWFIEGFAEFHSSAKFNPDGSVGIGLPARHRAYDLALGPALPVAKFVAADTSTLSHEQQLAIYSRGWLLTHYLTFSEERKGQLGRYLKAINEGRPPAAAATAAFGDLAALDQETLRYVKSKRMKYLELPAHALQVAPIAIRTLGAGEQALMSVRMQSRVGVDRKAALALLPKARKAAAPFTSDPAVQVALAEAEFDAGNWAAAEAAADGALAADPRVVDALLYKGRVRMELAKAAGAKDDATWKGVRRWFLDANKADPDDPEPLIHYHAAFLAAGAKPTKAAAEGLLIAHQFAPQDRRLRMLAAGQLLTDGKAVEARATLAPIAFDPHAGPAGQLASALIGLIDAGKAADATRTLAETGAKLEAEENAE